MESVMLKESDGQGSLPLFLIFLHSLSGCVSLEFWKVVGPVGHLVDSRLSTLDCRLEASLVFMCTHTLAHAQWYMLRVWFGFNNHGKWVRRTGTGAAQVSLEQRKNRKCEGKPQVREVSHLLLNCTHNKPHTLLAQWGNPTVTQSAVRNPL